MNTKNSQNIRRIRPQFIYSVASRIHSRKPLLYKEIDHAVQNIRSQNQEIMNLKKVEIFARRLEPSWLSIGSQPFYLHNSLHYQKCPDGTQCDSSHMSNLSDNT